MTIRWSQTAPSPDAAPEAGHSTLRRVLREASDLKDAGFGVARGLVAVAFVVVVLVAGLRYTAHDARDGGAAIKAPSFVAVPTAVPPVADPSPPPPDLANRAIDARDWYLKTDLDVRQPFSPVSRTGQALCAELAVSGFPKAAWGESQVFKGEWECASPSAEAGNAFMVVRGRDDETAGSVMLKLNATSEAAEAAFRAQAEAVLVRFAFGAAVEPDPEIAARLSAWEPGVFTHGPQTLRIVQQHDRAAPNVVHFSVSPRLPLAIDCGPDCFPLKSGTPDAAGARND